MLWVLDIHKEAMGVINQYMPYPGSDLFKLAIEKGFKPPKTTEEWYKVGRYRSHYGSHLELPWVDKEFCYYIEGYSFFSCSRIKLIQKICIFRLKHRFFKFPYDLKLMEFLYKQGFKDNLISKIERKLLRIFRSF
jgi:hypothetical protein